MTWNWQNTDWPNFHWEEGVLDAQERRFLQASGVKLGASRHLKGEDQSALIVELMTVEALKTSSIEGEVLDQASVQSSIRRNFGLDEHGSRLRSKPAEVGIADMLSDLYRHFDAPLTHSTLFTWHRMLINGRCDPSDIGRYRTHDDPMQVVSNRLDKSIEHFEAPPSAVLADEMEQVVCWWENSHPDASGAMPALARAGLTHLYFVCIHPFEDGNGRIGRALAEKALAECLGYPTLLALSQTIELHRKGYYAALERNNKSLDITDWLVWFASMITEAQATSLALVDFLIGKAKFYDRMRGYLNERQEKVIARMFREGPDGFTGGLSAENYIRIAGTSRATATRDLQDLVGKDALVKTGVLKSTRYWLNL